jgi:hypothetical protein
MAAPAIRGPRGSDYVDLVHVDITWMSRGLHVFNAWLSREYHVVVTLISRGNHVDVTCFARDCHVVVTWRQLLKYVMPT